MTKTKKTAAKPVRKPAIADAPETAPSAAAAAGPETPPSVETAAPPKTPKGRRKPKEENASPPAKAPTKIDVLLGLLRRPEGALITDLAAATGWQVHSVRGALAGHIKKKLALVVISEKTDAGRVYRVAPQEAAA